MNTVPFPEKVRRGKRLTYSRTLTKKKEPTMLLIHGKYFPGRIVAAFHEQGTKIVVFRVRRGFRREHGET